MSSEDNLHKVEAGFVAVNVRDIDAFLALLDPEFQLQLVFKPEMVNQPGAHNDKNELRAHFNLVYSAFPDYQMEQVSLRAFGNMVYHEVIVRGTHQGSFTLPTGVTISPTGRHVEIPVEVYHTFDPAGRFLSSTVNVNLMDVLKQFQR